MKSKFKFELIVRTVKPASFPAFAFYFSLILSNSFPPPLLFKWECDIPGMSVSLCMCAVCCLCLEVSHSVRLSYTATHYICKLTPRPQRESELFMLECRLRLTGWLLARLLTCGHFLFVRVVAFHSWASLCLRFDGCAIQSNSLSFFLLYHSSDCWLLFRGGFSSSKFNN